MSVFLYDASAQAVTLQPSYTCVLSIACIEFHTAKVYKFLSSHLNFHLLIVSITSRLPPTSEIQDFSYHTVLFLTFVALGKCLYSASEVPSYLGKICRRHCESLPISTIVNFCFLLFSLLKLSNMLI